MADEVQCTLYIKSSGCYLCQRVHMIAELKKLVPGKCKVIAVDERLKSTAMKDLDSTMLPVLTDDGKEYEDGEEIESHLERHFKEPHYPSLQSDDPKVKELTERKSPVSDFNKWIGLEDRAKSQRFAVKLAAYFKEVDSVLGKNREKGDFLDGNVLKLPDCILLPKLYHMKVVAEHLTGGDILKGYRNIQEYMDRAMKVKEYKDTIKPIDLTKFKLKHNCDIKDIQGR